MKILAIDTSQKIASVAIVADDIICAHISINRGRHHSEILMPAIEQAFRLTGFKPDEMDCFALTIGPGSFTGLRIAATTIKGLAMSTGKPVVGVSTLDALVHGAASAGQRMICPMLDAQKNQVYTALYGPGEGSATKGIVPEQVIDADKWLQELKGDIFFLGDGALKHSHLIHRHFSSAACIAEGNQNHLSAANVAALARNQFQRGELLNLLEFTPYYLRPSEAEIRVQQQT